ncbi:VOC family protein [Thioclava sp. GXIMD2076]|uniref:VOC family protein n=1 Tax=Thioclava kandeliae TaxID=3070818 RepID=A0ABV1SK34_9RHOB
MTDDVFLGLEHVALTVPDITEAEVFFEKAFGATILFRAKTKDEDPITGPEMNPINDLAMESAVKAITMIRIGSGPNIELFEVENTGRKDQPRFEDQGYHHICIYCRDMQEAIAKLKAAGAEILKGPIDGGGPEEGPGNQSQFCKTPWGLIIEFNHMPSPMHYAKEATQTRYFPD